VAARESPRLAKYVASSMEEARKRNPKLTDLDKLAEIMPAEQITYWSYFSYEYIFV